MSSGFMLQIAYEVGLILEKPDVRDEFNSAFLCWCHAIIEYCKSTQVRSTALQQVTADFDKDLSSLGECVLCVYGYLLYSIMKLQLGLA